MPIAQYSLTWDYHKSYFCDGFVNLQQKEEFVDLTLAADGHLVSVHKIVFALASPYIKAMLQSTHTRHPVIFLNNVSLDILNYIIIYVYTGEVYVDVDKITLFMKAAKELCLRGFGNIKVPEDENRRHDTGNKTQVNSEIPNVIISGQDIIQEANRNVQMNGTREQIVVHDSSINNTIPSASIHSTTKTQGINTNFQTNTISEQSVCNPSINSVIHKVLIPDHTTVQGPNTSVQINARAQKIGMNNCSMSNVNTEQHFGLDDVNVDLMNDITTGHQVVKENTKNRESGLYTTADGYQYRLELPYVATKNTESILETCKKCTDDCKCFTEEINTVDTNIASPISTEEEGDDSLCNKGIMKTEADTVQYTVSNRGALQLILNGYMYYCHYESNFGTKRRWRCLNYRTSRCSAFIDTDFENITIRKCVHSHPHHHDKIMKKIRQKNVFNNLNILLQNLKNKKQENE